jgi:hypothetical protein
MGPFTRLRRSSEQCSGQLRRQRSCLSREQREQMARSAHVAAPGTSADPATTKRWLLGNGLACLPEASHDFVFILNYCV